MSDHAQVIGAVTEIVVGVVAVAAFCGATAGIGCLIVAGAVAGAAGYTTRVGLSSEETFSATGLAQQTLAGAAAGAVSAGAGPMAKALIGKVASTATSRAIAEGASDAADVASKATPTTNKIYSNRVLNRMADEPGPMHNFPGTFDHDIFTNGTRTVSPNFFNKPKPNLGNDSIQYRLPGEINGKAGVFEIFTRGSVSGRSELIMHRFFRPSY